MEERDLKNSSVYQSKFGKKDRWSVLYVMLTLLLVCMLAVRIYFAQNYFCVEVVGSSMCPTLENGDVLLVRYGSEAKRGDIIIVDVRPYKTDPEKKKLVKNEFKTDTNYLIKRLIAIEGDTVCCKDGNVLIRYADKEYGEDEWDLHPSDQYIKDDRNDDFGVYEVGEGEIFFLGDNRMVSQDSRYREESKPHLEQLYKAEDICGVVPDWAYENKDWLEYVPGIYDPKRKK